MFIIGVPKHNKVYDQWYIRVYIKAYNMRSGKGYTSNAYNMEIMRYNHVYDMAYNKGIQWGI